MKYLSLAATAIGVALISPPAAAQTVNIAPTGIATQSSNWALSTPASDAIDGNTDPNFNAGSMQHTGNDLDAWWRVDFASLQGMTEVRLYNRADCCGTRLSNFRVSVFSGTTEVFGADLYTGVGSVPQGGVETIPLPNGTVGDAVRVQFLGFNNDGNGYMHMAEIEIDGNEVGTTYCTSNPNSTGATTEIFGAGSNVVAANNLHLLAVNVPLSQFGFFVTSPTPANMPAANSAGVLCLGGPYARFNAQVLQTADHGTAVGTRIDLSFVPLGVPTAVLPGQTWYFQYWHRDTVSPSNFSNGLMVAFQ